MKRSSVVLLVAVCFALIIVGGWKGCGAVKKPAAAQQGQSEPEPGAESKEESGAEAKEDKPESEEKSESEKPESEKSEEGKSEEKKDEEEKDEGEKKDEEQEPEGDPNNPMEAINLDDVEIKTLLPKLGEWTGKAIIPTNDELMKTKITIYYAKKKPRSEALSLIYDAMRAKGVVAEQIGDRIFLKPIAEAKLGAVPTLGPDDPLARLEDKSQIVEKFFKIKNYSPLRVVTVITPLVAEYGHVMSIESTGTVAVIDTVDNLIRIERIINELDVPESEEIVEEFFEVQGDTVELSQVLERILDVQRRGRRGGRGGRPSSPAGGRAVTLESIEVEVQLIPLPKQKLIIARGSAADIENIEKWLNKLDTGEQIRPEQGAVQERRY